MSEKIKIANEEAINEMSKDKIAKDVIMLVHQYMGGIERVTTEFNKQAQEKDAQKDRLSCLLQHQSDMLEILLYFREYINPKIAEWAEKSLAKLKNNGESDESNSQS